MRPELLELKNFGPFCGEHHVDFADLGDFFLVCGETGAGKTTLFDAISYAFYGEAPGGRKGLSRQLRSQYVESFDESYVLLTFSIGPRRYRIKRTLPRDRISSRTKAVKTDPEEVSLEWQRDGRWTVLAPGNKRDTDAEILNLVKLSADEFSRIVLLPQGEFSRFLKQNSEERKEILSKLFPVSIYSLAAEKIKDKANTARLAAGEALRQKNALLASFNPDTFEAEKRGLDDEVSSLKKEGDALNQKIIEVSHLLEKARRIAEKQGRLKEAEDSFQKEIEAQKEDCIAWQERLDAGNRAAPVAGFIREYKGACAELEAAKLKLAKAATQLEETEKEINLLENDRSKAESADGERARLVEQKTRIEGAVAAAAEYEKSAKEIASLQSQKASKEKEKAAIEAEIARAEAAIKEKEDMCGADAIMRLTQAKATADRDCEVTEEKAARTERHIKQSAALVALQEKERCAKEEAAAKEAALKEAENELESALAAFTAEKDRQKAAELASSLAEGAPCPVCGSVHHPAPAAASEGNIERLGQQAEAAKLHKADADKEWQEATLAAGKTEVELKNLSSLIEETEEEGSVFESGDGAAQALKSAKENARKAAQALKSAEAALKEVAEQKMSVEALRKRLEDADKALQETMLYLAGLAARSEDAIKRFKAVFPEQNPQRAAAAKALSDCEDAMAKLEQFVKGFRQKDESLKSQKATLEGSLKELNNSSASLTAKAASAELKMKEECAAAGFETAEAAEAASLAQGQKAELSNKIESFKARKAELENQIAVFREDLAAEKANAPQDADSEKLSAEYEALRLSANENAQKRDEAVAALSALEGNRKRWDALQEECAAKEEAAAALSSLSADLQGKNPRNIKFEAWILRQYLEEITEYANRRIARLSDDRYRLRCDSNFRKGNSKTGLDLEIFDSYTGKTRPVATLSGGETFMASISLALGLSDSIQARKGGIQLESVFIDEGFGSLDNEHIDRAMNILNEIREHRMIGIISHIAELKERIPEKLEVKKKASGGSELHVNLLEN